MLTLNAGFILIFNAGQQLTSPGCRWSAGVPNGVSTGFGYDAFFDLMSAGTTAQYSWRGGRSSSFRGAVAPRCSQAECDVGVSVESTE